MYEESAYPIAVFCIIATEFCERFAFSGLRTILSLYLRNVLLFSENASTVIYHVFIMVCYIVPMAGAICADVYFGRYRTIRNFAIVYLVGHILMFIAAVPAIDKSPTLFTFVGLALIAIGTGGIKPCVAAFGAEQFNLPSQKALMMHFFSIFYFTINLGGFVGMTLTPILKKVSCFGDDTCYALGFGFPAALMILSIFLFVVGRNFYKLKYPKKKVIMELLKCSQYALALKLRKKPRTGHWLDAAKTKFNPQLIEDMKVVSKILVLFTPLPLFWSLFDQQGSRWTFQASHMNGNIMGTRITPDQFQVVNPAMVLIIIPILDRIFYPCFSKCNILENSLHRMALGGVIAGLAFLSAGILELVLETTYPDVVKENEANVDIINTLPCNLKIMTSFDGLQILNAGHIFRFKNIVYNNNTIYKFNIETPLICEDIIVKKNRFDINTILFEQQANTILISSNDKNEIQSFLTGPGDFEQSLTGLPKVRIMFIKNSIELYNVTVCLKTPGGFQDIYYVPDQDLPSTAVSAYMEIPEGLYECQIKSAGDKLMYEKLFHLTIGGVYYLVIRENKQGVAVRKVTDASRESTFPASWESKFVKLYTISIRNTVNILWQLPQYFLISVAEIMFGVAGLEFSFSQAPRSMKTVTIAGWYLSVAVGNFLVIIITQLDIFKSQAYEFFLFGVLIVADMMLFMEMASSYTFVTVKESSTTLTTGGVAEEKVPFINPSTTSSEDTSE